MMIADAVLLALLLVAAATDVREHKIYNWTTYPGILLGVALNGMGTLLEHRGTDEAQAASWQSTLGSIGLEESLIGLAVCGAFMLVCYVFFNVGGGDVKLMAMLGAFLGLEQGLESLLWTFVLAACLGISILAWRVGPWHLLGRVLRQAFYTLRIGGWPGLTPEERRQLQFPLFLAPTAPVAVVIVRFSLLVPSP